MPKNEYEDAIKSKESYHQKIIDLITNCKPMFRVNLDDYIKFALCRETKFKFNFNFKSTKLTSPKSTNPKLRTVINYTRNLFKIWIFQK